MKKLATLLAVLFSVAASLPAAGTDPPPTNPSKENFYLFLLAGQSNMAGRGRVNPKDNLAHPRVFTLTEEDTWRPATDPLHSDSRHAGVGIGKRFGEIVAEDDPKLTIGLIPAAVGGSRVRQWMRGSKKYDRAIARAKAAMEQGTLKAILWHQGESDCEESRAPHYEERLREVIESFREDLGTPDLPFFIGQLGQFSKAPWEEPQKTVDAAQRHLAESMPHVYFISSDGLTGANPHFNTKSLHIFSERYAKAYLDL